MTVIAGRSLSLLCDSRAAKDCRAAKTYNAQTLPACRKLAVAAGWVIGRNRRSCTCGPCFEAFSHGLHQQAAGGGAP